MNYNLIPTTVFTPDEYAFTGLTQEEAERDEKRELSCSCHVIISYVPCHGIMLCMQPSQHEANHITSYSCHIIDGGIGAENVEVFWSRYGSLEISPQHPVSAEEAVSPGDM